MKFVILVSTLTIFAILAGQGEATLDAVTNELSNKIIKVLATAAEKPQQDTFQMLGFASIGALTLNYFWIYQLVTKEKSIKKKKLGRKWLKHTSYHLYR